MKKGLDKTDLPEGHEQVAQEWVDMETFLREGRMRYEPRKSEAGVIEIIKAQVEEQVGALFLQADRVLAEFYGHVRIPRADGGQNETGEVWETREDGSYVEDWTRMTTVQLDAGMFGLQRAITNLERISTELYLHAQFAYNVWDDTYQERYKEPAGGTIQDRTATARRKTKDERYYYMFSYWMWRTVSDRIKTLKDIRWMMQNRAQRNPAGYKAKTPDSPGFSY